MEWVALGASREQSQLAGLSHEERQQLNALLSKLLLSVQRYAAQS